MKRNQEISTNKSFKKNIIKTSEALCTWTLLAVFMLSSTCELSGTLPELPAAMFMMLIVINGRYGRLKEKIAPPDHAMIEFMITRATYSEYLDFPVLAR